MAFFDKIERTINTLNRKLEKASGPEKVKLLTELKKIKRKDPDWYAECRDRFGKRRSEKCPPQYQSKVGAKKYEALFIAKIFEGTASRHDAEKATVSEILDYHLVYLKRKSEKSGKTGGYKSSITISKHLKKDIGHFSLKKLDFNPDILEQYFYDFPGEYAQKYVYNHFLDLRASFNRWIKHKKIRIFNPCDTIEIDPNTNVAQYVPTPHDLEKVYMTSMVVGLPDSFRNLLLAVYESGLRISEVIGWQVEDLDLKPPIFNENGFPVRLPSFLTEIKKQKKIEYKSIPMSKELWEILKTEVGSELEGHVWPWQTPPHKLIRESGLMKEANVPFTRPFHDYRKSRKMINRVEKRLPDIVSREFQGHATDAMNDYYSKLGTKDLFSAVEDSWRSDAA